jgi:predicted DNA-binding transcriptional regulator YafY
MSTKLERLIYIDACIREGAYPRINTFIDRFEVSRRTILNDIQFLKDRLDAPIAYSHAHNGYFYTDPRWTLTTLPATEGQLLAFFLSVELAQRYLGTTFEQPLREAIQHMTSILPSEVQVTVSELASHYTIRAGAAAKSPMDLLLDLQRAIQNYHPVDMKYFTARRGEETQRVIHPYHLFNLHGEWYLIAYDLFRQSIRQFALPRIRQWTVLDNEYFDVDPAFSPEFYFGNSFQSEHGDEKVNVVLLFDAYQARYIRERTWHSSQQFEEQPDGGIILRFTTGAIGEVQRWILGYGSHVKVLAPERLAQAIVAEYHESLDKYET